MSIATKCTCGYSITGVCTSSVKECRQLRKENTQLPKEVVEEISEKAHELAMNNTDLGYLPSDRIIQSIENRVKTLATAYATKLQHSEERNSILLDEMSNLSKLLQEKDDKLHQANETIKVLEYYNNNLKGEVDGLTNAVAELRTKYDNILATESGHESKTENVWQSGYAAGHEAGCEKRITAAAMRIADKLMVIVRKQLEVDESAAGRESDRNEFAEWCRVQPNYGFVRGMGWMCSITHEYFTTDFMYELFKQQKIKV